MECWDFSSPRFGFDFLIDEKHNVWFLEANAFPDFQQTGARLESVIGKLFDDVVTVTADSFFYGVDIIPPQLRLVYDLQRTW
mmetsp:Transcript_6868/g.14126  ORF Transcript_6868/g.14126 Transcript_6868/m.14126 type:complete len:82 (+) Transcript_6868:906-1151(+)